MRQLRNIVPFVAATVMVSSSCGSGPSLDTPLDSESTITGIDQSFTLGNIVGSAPIPANGSSSVVILYPDTPTDVPVPTEPAEMDQLGREFIPRLLIIRQGQPVVFKNSEDDLHTVHVKDEYGTSLFNVAMPYRGGLHDHAFEAAGDYAVSCEAHQEMSATILVLTTPYATVADRDGHFSFSGLPTGSYRLILRRAKERHERTVEIVDGRNELTLSFPTTGL